jgi:hypothetical protein
VKLLYKDGKEVKLQGQYISEPYSKDVRDERIQSIVVNLA